MNTLVAASLAQAHVDSMVAAAAVSRRAKQARIVRRAHRRAARHVTDQSIEC